jgi:hypothetical protein
MWCFAMEERKKLLAGGVRLTPQQSTDVENIWEEE